MSTVRGRQRGIINNLSANQSSLNNSRARQRELTGLIDADRIVLSNLVARVDRTRFVKNNVKLLPLLNSNTSIEFIVTASHNANDAWKVFTSTTGFYWNSGVLANNGEYVESISIQIILSTSTRIHKIGLRARSDSEIIKSWSSRAKNEDRRYHTIYNPDPHNIRAKDVFIFCFYFYFSDKTTGLNRPLKQLKLQKHNMNITQIKQQNSDEVNVKQNKIDEKLLNEKAMKVKDYQVGILI